MVNVCAWCNNFLNGASEGEVVSHSICPHCLSRMKWKKAPTLVIGRADAHNLPIIEHLLRGKPEIPLLVERRTRGRRVRESYNSSERRSGNDRRCL